MLMMAFRQTFRLPQRSLSLLHNEYSIPTSKALMPTFALAAPLIFR